MKPAQITVHEKSGARQRRELLPGGHLWESSFTKPSLATRRLVRRRRNAAAKIARRANR